MTDEACAVARAIALGTACLVIAACSLQRAQEAADAQRTMVGMPKEQVLSCMGAPVHSATAGNTEVWTYNSGNLQSDDTGVRFCKVDIVMVDGRISRVNYSGPTGGLISQGEQCAYAVDNCVRGAAH